MGWGPLYIIYTALQIPTHPLEPRCLSTHLFIRYSAVPRYPSCSRSSNQCCGNRSRPNLQKKACAAPASLENCTFGGGLKPEHHRTRVRYGLIQLDGHTAVHKCQESKILTPINRNSNTITSRAYHPLIRIIKATHASNRQPIAQANRRPTKFPVCRSFHPNS